MITKSQAAQIDELLSDLVKLGGMNYVNAVQVARRTLAEATEGQILSQQLKRARQREQLPSCTHDEATAQQLRNVGFLVEHDSEHDLAVVRTIDEVAP